MLSTFKTNIFLVQVLIFLIIGIILLITTRPLLQKLINKCYINKHSNQIIGMKGIVTEEINKNQLGEVKVADKIWNAYSDKDISINALIEVLEINDLKLKVKEIKENKK